MLTAVMEFPAQPNARSFEKPERFKVPTRFLLGKSYALKKMYSACMNPVGAMYQKMPPHVSGSLGSYAELSCVPFFTPAELVEFLRVILRLILTGQAKSLRRTGMNMLSAYCVSRSLPTVHICITVVPARDVRDFLPDFRF